MGLPDKSEIFVLVDSTVHDIYTINYNSSVLSANICFLSFLYLPSKIYANGPEIKIDEYDPKMTHIPIVKANCWITPEPRRNIARITTKVETTVPKDLLIVCQRLSSNILPNNTHLIPHLFWIFSLTLSKIIIVSLILYPILVSNAIINTESIITVLSKYIQIPYMPAGNDTSKIIVPIVTAARTPGAIYFLIVAKENIIYIAIRSTHTIIAVLADFCI